MQTLLKPTALLLLMMCFINAEAQFISSKDKKTKEGTNISRGTDLASYSRTLILLKKEYRLNKTDNINAYLQQLMDVMEREIIRTEAELATAKPGNDSRNEIVQRLKDEKRILQSVRNFDQSKTNVKALLYLQKMLDQFEYLMKQALETKVDPNNNSQLPDPGNESTILYGEDTHISASSTVSKGQRQDRYKNKGNPNNQEKKTVSRKEIANQLIKLNTGIQKAYQIQNKERAKTMFSNLIKQMELVIAANKKQLQQMRDEGMSSSDSEYKILNYKTQKLTASKKRCTSLSLPAQLDELDKKVNEFNHYIR